MPVSQGLLTGAEGRLSAWWCALLSSVKVIFMRERCSCDWEAELTWVTPGAGVATQSHQGCPEAAIGWVSGSPSAFQMSGVDSLIVSTFHNREKNHLPWKDSLDELNYASYWASQVAQWKKICLPVQEMQEAWVRSLEQEDPLEEEIATHSSIHAWRISWTEEAGGLQSMGSQRVGHDWALARCIVLPQRTNIYCTILFG